MTHLFVYVITQRCIPLSDYERTTEKTFSKEIEEMEVKIADMERRLKEAEERAETAEALLQSTQTVLGKRKKQASTNPHWANSRKAYICQSNCPNCKQELLPYDLTSRKFKYFFL